jgi:hypothetical protein
MLAMPVCLCPSRWSGEAVDELEGRLKDSGFSFAFPAIRVKFRPTAKVRVLPLSLGVCWYAGANTHRLYNTNMHRQSFSASYIALFT